MTVHRIEPASHEDAVRRAAGWLRAHGAVAGERVIVSGANDPRLLAVTHGALRSGVVPVLLNPALPEEDRAWMLRDCDARLAVDVRGIAFEDAAPVEVAPLPLGRPMLYTSGTTGWPKGVWPGVLDEPGAAAYARDEADLWAPEPGSCAIVASPLHHSAPHRSATAALLAGATVLLFERFDALALADALASERVSSTFLVPTHLRRLFALDPPPPREIVRVCHAGEPCPEPLKRRALGWFPAGTLWEFYGSTEGQFTAIAPDEWLEHPGSVGRARAGRSLSVDDPDADGVGVVRVSAPPFARWEYWRDPERTAAAWRGDTFTVGDLGSLDDDGYLTLVSRREDLIISGGVNVYPAMVERVLSHHPAVHEIAVFGVADREWGQRVCAAVVGVGGDEIATWATGKLDGAFLPKSFVSLDALPRTATGKVDRRALATLVS